MSSPAGFSVWRRRTSLNAQDAPPPPNQPGDGIHGQPTSTASSHREPIRSFIHGSIRDQLVPVDGVESVRSVRHDTAELASYFLSPHKKHPAFLARTRSQSSQTTAGNDRTLGPAHASAVDAATQESTGHCQEVDSLTRAVNLSSEDSTAEASEPPASKGEMASDRRSMLADSLRRCRFSPALQAGQARRTGEASETSPLVRHAVPHDRLRLGLGAHSQGHDVEGQKNPDRRWVPARRAGERMRGLAKACWDRRVVWRVAVAQPVSCLPAVLVGLLLNMLDALSYGMILFPLGSPVFAHLGSAGISIFYVSTIIAQLCFSLGSIFRGGVGSELIEVVPFFHSMAFKIMGAVGDDAPDAVIATTITAYAASSVLTGAVFYLMGRFRFGYIVGFIPRHILIGCVGGVGCFLVATGFQVTARVDGAAPWRFVQADTVPLWSIPLVLSIVLFGAQTRVSSRYFLPFYILAIPAVFYVLVASLGVLNADSLRRSGWVFDGPPVGEPWWYFFSLYRFDTVRWAAIVECVPAMLALTFFGILHVPINVPALALSTGEDHADLDRELKLHGCSNLLSGCAGCVPNYLVYANTLVFMRAGGDSRTAGVMLAAFTAVVMVVGPSLIGFIPVMMVGVLIFDLGFELVLEAVWSPRKKLKLPEYLTVIVIVLIMGVYDFVVGIGVGILLAFVSLIVQTSRVSAVRSSYSGDVVGSTVRRNHSQQHYLQLVGRQVFIIKLAGFLFFGTIVGVEEKIRGLIQDEAFKLRPIRFLILDLWQVTGLDYSAGEAFKTVSRLLHGKGIELVLSGLDPESPLGRDFGAVGLGEDGIEVALLPDLNSALECCENELLKTLCASQEAAGSRLAALVSSANLDLPAAKNFKNQSQSHTRTRPHQNQPQHSLPPQYQPRHPSPTPLLDPAAVLCSSPRRSHLHEAAHESILQTESTQFSDPQWRSLAPPLRLMLQIFHDLSPTSNQDFCFRAAPYFDKLVLPQGHILFRRSDPADVFYLVERGILRLEYNLPQGKLCERVVAGTTCGELPFFSETGRTATAMVESEDGCVLWRLTRSRWETLQREECEVAKELLRVGLKLTSERMIAITGYTLTMAG